MGLPKQTASGDRLADMVWDLMPDAHCGVIIRKPGLDLVVWGHDGIVTEHTEEEITSLVEWLTAYAAVRDYGRCEKQWTWVLTVPILQAKTRAAAEFHRTLIEEVVWEIWAAVRNKPIQAGEQLRAYARGAIARM